MVNVYWMWVNDLPDPLEHPEVMDALPKERREKILRYKQRQDRKLGLGAGILLEKVLAQYGISSHKVTCLSNGKPQVEGIHFNLSHAGEVVVCAVSTEPVGCDIELVEHYKDRVAERFFSEGEKRYLNQFDEEQRSEEFFRLWTMKESYLKMTGEGMRVPLDTMEFVLGEEVILYRDGEICPCKVKEYEIPGYKISVCAGESEFTEEMIRI